MPVVRNLPLNFNKNSRSFLGSTLALFNDISDHSIYSFFTPPCPLSSKYDPLTAAPPSTPSLFSRLISTGYVFYQKGQVLHFGSAAPDLSSQLFKAAALSPRTNTNAEKIILMGQWASVTHVNQYLTGNTLTSISQNCVDRM